MGPWSAESKALAVSTFQAYDSHFYKNRDDAVAVTSTPGRVMSAPHRAMAPSVALAIGIMACSDPLTTHFPADSPGVAVPGVNFHNGWCTTGSDCMTWSADSKTLYLVENLSPPLGGSLRAVDAATHTVRRIGGIDTRAAAPALSPDGTMMYFAVPADTTNSSYDIRRMSLADGSTTVVTSASSRDFLVSPDGAALAYHARGGPSAPDTVVLLDLASGARRASTVVTPKTLGAFSADGTRLIMYSGVPDPGAIQVWHVATGARDTIPFPTRARYLEAARWSRGDFRLLLTATNYPGLTDMSVGGGAAITYSSGTSQSVWLSDRAAIWVASWSTICGPNNCNMKRYEFAYVTATKATTVGSLNEKNFYLLAASPDGRWLAHVADDGTLYLLNQPTP